MQIKGLIVIQTNVKPTIYACNKFQETYYFVFQHSLQTIIRSRACMTKNEKDKYNKLQVDIK